MKTKKNKLYQTKIKQQTLERYMQNQTKIQKDIQTRKTFLRSTYLSETIQKSSGLTKSFAVIFRQRRKLTFCDCWIQNEMWQLHLLNFQTNWHNFDGFKPVGAILMDYQHQPFCLHHFNSHWHCLSRAQ